MAPITFHVQGVPMPQPRARSFVLRGRGGQPILTKTGQPILRVHDPGTAEHWKSQLALAAKPFVPFLPLTGPLSLTLSFKMPRPKAHYRTNGQLKPNAPKWHTSRGDVDNLFKAVSDALTVLGMWSDDAQIAQTSIEKVYAETPGATITIEQLDSIKLTAEPAIEQEALLL